MDLVRTPTRAVALTDLVLEPDRYHDALIGAARRDDLGYEAAERLAALLPLAIAQLEAIGDEYGAMALTGLSDQLTRLQLTV